MIDISWNIRKTFFTLCGVFAIAAVFVVPIGTDAAELSLSPSSGTFIVGSTFDVDVLLDTENESVNAFEIFLKFSPQTLQIVSPSTGKSIVEVWTGPPKYDNGEGTVTFRGGIPDGINVSKGLISRLTFRVKQTGQTVVKFGDTSRVLLNDGIGTDRLNDAQSGVYNFVLPPPAGPIVASETHQIQSQWYPLTTAILRWEGIGASGYSYILSDDPIYFPDTISEGANSGVAYKNLSSGTHYFHVRALRSSTWGGTTHFAINVDTEPPATFPIEINPSKRTTNKRPIVAFRTTDAQSGIDRYEYKIIPLTPSPTDVGDLFFIETKTEQILDLGIGSYDIIVRAYDRAGNFREETVRLDIITPLFRFVNGDGLRIADAVNIPWFWVIVIGLLMLGALGYGGWRVEKWHHALIIRRTSKELPEHVEGKLAELRKYREKFGKIAVVLFLLSSIFWGASVEAQGIELSPPFVETVSKNISNEEIFYVGGKTDASGVDVLIYLQNLQSGETVGKRVTSDKRNEWFYRHDTFLPSGNYLLWAQTKIGEELSPPGPQITLNVRPTAIQFGASRLSFETLYLIGVIILFLAVIGLIAFIAHHAHHGRKLHHEFMKEVREAEESVRRGFAVLKRDIQAELDVIHRAKLSKALSEEEHIREAELLKDLAWAEQYIGKEIWDIEATEHHH